MKSKNDKDKYDQASRSGIDLDFYRWTISRSLGAPLDYWITDVDGVIRDRAGNLQLLEIKRKNAELKAHQARTIAILDALIRAGIEALGGVAEIEINGRKERHKINYHGAKVLQLSGVSFFDSEFKIDGRKVTPEELSELLKFDERNQTAAGSAHTPESYKKNTST